MIAASNNTVFGVWAGSQCYAITQAQMDHLGLTDPTDTAIDVRGRPLIYQELGPLFGHAPSTVTGRRHTITVTLRRRSVALLVDRIDSLDTDGSLTIQALAPLLTRRLTRPWFLGALIYAGEPLLLLDLRRIATDIAIGAVNFQEG
ncbi:MAG: hypothetical protein HGA19_16735 [Oscillochloris sp.]|nr:hypothetical protein [Oscillochloris sp.]